MNEQGRVRGQLLIGTADFSPGLFVAQFDWEYYLLIACGLGLLVIGALAIFAFAS